MLILLSCRRVSPETGKNDRGRIWSHATEQTWFTSRTGIRNKRFYVASGVWDTCPTSKQPYSKWGIARIAVIAHECAHFLGLPGMYSANFELFYPRYDVDSSHIPCYFTRQTPMIHKEEQVWDRSIFW